MDFTTLPFEYEGRYASEYADLGFTIEQGAWLEQRDRDLEDHLAGLDAGGGGGVPTLFVASSEAVPRSKEYADYVCDGVADDVEINAALAAVYSTFWGGRVLLSEGQFNLSDELTVNYGSTLQGLGKCTYLESTHSAGVSLTGGSTTLRDLVLYGPESGVGVALGDYSQVINCNLGNFGTVIYGSAAMRAAVQGSEIAGSGTYGIDLTGVGSMVDISGNYLNLDLRIASNLTLVRGNRCDSGCSISITGGANNCIDGNYLHGGLASFSDAGSGTQRGTNFSSGGTW